MRELRIAPVMTGGTSLAVWMAGVSYELYRMTNAFVGDDRATPTPGQESNEAGQRIYASLLDLTGTVPVIDVITGTSAGGLNGTLLGAATHLGVRPADFATIRDTWLDVADLEQLMRPTGESNPPSLLKGDDYFAVQVARKLDEWRTGTTRSVTSPKPSAVDVVTTVTTLEADTIVRSDDFGEQLVDATHAHRLRFTEDTFATDDWVQKLAISARTSASIPGVFEPSFLPVGGKALGRPDFGPHASFDASRWAVDGGVVVNMPLTEALDRIFNRPASGEVRRVVLYVSPTPKAYEKSEADDPKAQPTLLASLLSIPTAPRAEGISRDVDLLLENNARVHRQRAARRTIVGLLADVDLSDPPATAFGTEVFAAYARIRADESVASMLGRLEGETAREVAVRRREISEALRGPRERLLPADWDVGDGSAWGWGIASVQQAISQVVALLSRAAALPSSDTVAADLDALNAIKAHVHEQREVVERIRDADQRFWRHHVRVHPAPSAAGASGSVALTDWALGAYATWPSCGPACADEDDLAPSSQAQTLADLAGAHRLVAAALVDSLELIRRVVDATPTTPPSLASERQAIVDELGGMEAIVSRMGRGQGPGRSERVRAAQQALLAVHVCQTVFLGDVVDAEQPAELMQISFNSWNGLDERRTGQDKLAGPELGRLGAFVKRSWRANDWTWGRMDGAYRLVLLLLDPAQLRRMGTVEAFRSWLQILAGGPGATLSTAVEEELGLLADTAVDPPTALPSIARFVACRLQETIAQEELPLVAEAVARSEADGSNESDSRAFRSAVEREQDNHGAIRAGATADLVQKMQIGKETVRSEFGFGLMNRILLGLISVSVNAVTGDRSGIPVLPRVLKPLRAPLHAVTSLVRVMTRDSKLGQAVASATLAVAGAVIALRIAGQDPPAWLFAVSATLFIVMVVAAMMRSGFIWLSLVVGLGASVIALSLLGSDVEDLVYDTTTVQEQGTLEGGTELVFDDEGRLRIASEDGERIVDIDVPAGSKVGIGSQEVDTSRETDDDPAEAGWKRWGFTARWSIGFVVASAAFVALLFRLGATWRDLDARGRRARVAGVVCIGLVAALIRPVSDAVLTGSDDDPGWLSDWKEVLVDGADKLSEYQLAFVLVVLVGAGILLSIGADLYWGRWARGARRWLGERLHRPGH